MSKEEEEQQQQQDSNPSRDHAATRLVKILKNVLIDFEMFLSRSNSFGTGYLCLLLPEYQEADGIGSDFGGDPGSEVPRCQPKQLQRLWRHPNPPLHRLQTKRQVHAKPQEVSQALSQAGNRLQR